VTSASVPRTAPATPRSWAQTAELVYLLVLKDLRVRYKSSVLGYLWAVANPLAFALVYYVAFGVILRAGAQDNFAILLLTGLFPWSWAANALVHATGVYRHNTSLVRKVQVRRAALPLGITLQEMLHFFLTVPILIGAIVLTTGEWHASWVITIPLMAVVQLALIYPITVILAAANVLVRDVEYLVGIALQMVFFLTPIVYPASAIPPALRPYFAANPFMPLINGWREVLLRGQLDVTACFTCLGFAAVAGLLAAFAHQHVEPKMGELL
jgi:lipopolysaccharide transport system permease protein